MRWIYQSNLRKRFGAQVCDQGLLIGTFHGHRVRFSNETSSLWTRSSAESISVPIRQPQVGDAQIRAKGRQIHRPNPNLIVDPNVLDSYVCRYQIVESPVIEVSRDGKRLMLKVQGQADVAELVPETDADYIVPSIGVRVSFVRDASGKVTGFTGYQNGDFEGKKLN
jgi:hypothetical protein